VLATFHKDEVPDIATTFMEVDFAYCDPTESHECVFVQARGVSGEGLRVRGGNGPVRPDRPNDPCPQPRPVARYAGSAGTDEAAFMVEGMARPTPTRLPSSPKFDSRLSSSGLLKCEQKCRPIDAFYTAV